MADQLTNPRELRGLAILSQPDTVREVRKNHWMVKSQSGNGEYLVEKTFVKGRDAGHRHNWSCSCPDHQTRHVLCKHIFSVQFSLKLKGEIETDSAQKQIEAAQVIIACPYCKGRGSHLTREA